MATQRSAGESGSIRCKGGAKLGYFSRLLTPVFDVPRSRFARTTGRRWRAVRSRILPAGFLLGSAVWAQADVTVAVTPGTTARATLRTELDTFFDERFATAPTVTVADLRGRARAADVSDAELEAMVRAGRATYGPSPVPPGKLTGGLRLACDHVDYETSYLLYVPSTYTPTRTWPLVLVGHGGNGEMEQARAERTARSYIGAFVDAAEKAGVVLAAPATARGWGWIGNSVLFSLVSVLQRELAIDPDRIYVTGHSMGGHLSWRCGIFYPDRFGAVGPMSGGYDYVANEQVTTLFDVPGYATHGRNEPYQIADFNRKIAAWMQAHHYADWTIVEKPGGHEIFADEVPRALAFFVAHPRNLYRDVVEIRATGANRIDRSEPKRPGWDRDHTWRSDRPIRGDTWHWVSVFDGPADAPVEARVQRARVTRTSRSAIDVRAKHVRKLRFYLHPRMFDLDAPIAVTVNGKPRKLTPQHRGLDVMLDLARSFDDRGRIFWATLDVDVEGDVEVPAPGAK